MRVDKNSVVLLIISLLFAMVTAKQPNYVRTYMYDDPITGKSKPNVFTSTSYSDGIGRKLQDQIILNDINQSIVNGILYDEVGRPCTTILPFLDNSVNKYIKYDKVLQKAKAYYSNNQYPFSETDYYKDPLGRVRAKAGPTETFSLSRGEHISQIWYLGADDCLPCDSLDNSKLDNMLPANENYNYFLTVIKSTENTYTQVLADKFGNTVKTWAHPSQKGKAGTSSCDEDSAIVTTYRYDVNGNLLYETPPAPQSVKTVYTYNTMGQVVSKKTSDAGLVQYCYSPVGLLDTIITEKMRTRSEKLCYRYDFLDRLIQVCVQRVISTTLRQFFTKIRNFYDYPSSAKAFIAPVNTSDQALLSINDLLSEGNRNFPQNTRGRLAVSIAYGESCSPGPDLDYTATECPDRVIEVYSYNFEGNLTKKWKYIPGLPIQEFTFTYYDLSGNLKKAMCKFGPAPEQTVEREYLYDANARLCQINVNRSKAVEYFYDPFGKLKNKKFYNKAGTVSGEEDRIYDDMLSMLKEINAGSRFSQELFYHDNPEPTERSFNGNISGSIINQNTASDRTINLSYKYDDVSRLVGVTHKWPGSGDNSYTGHYTYDKLGRFQSKSEGNSVNTGYDYELNALGYKTNRISKISSKLNEKTYIYDPDGNMAFDRLKKMGIVYDWRNLPVEFRFYSNVPIDVNWAEAGALEVRTGITLTSFVKVLYDANGNRVLKTETVR